MMGRNASTGRKGQAVFEFVIASLLLFAIIVYTLNYISSNFGLHHSIYSSSRLEGVALRVSDFLVSDADNGFADAGGWPRMSRNKMLQFEQDCNCQDCDYYDLLESLDLKDSEPYDRYTRINIQAENEDGTSYVSCGRTPPEDATQGTVTRFGYVPDDNRVVKITVIAW